jgi:hypothetical protein
MKKSLKSIWVVLSEWSLATWVQLLIMFAFIGTGAYSCANLMSEI